MGMLSSLNLCTSGFSRFLVGTAIFSEVTKRVRVLNKQHRSFWTYRRTWKDGRSGVSAADSMVNQFRENGSCYFQFGAEIFNEMFDVLCGENWQRIDAEEYRVLHEALYNTEDGEIDVEVIKSWVEKNMDALTEGFVWQGFSEDPTTDSDHEDWELSFPVIHQATAYTN